MENDYTVLWRSGGTENGQWHTTNNFTLAEAIITKESVERMGYPSIVISNMELLKLIRGKLPIFHFGNPI